jgi:hypothetical protein
MVGCMSADPRAPGLIATHFRIDKAAREPLSVGGLKAWPVQDERSPGRPLLAIRTDPAAPPRARFFMLKSGFAPPNVVMPIESGPGRDLAGAHGWFAVCDALPGPSLASEKPAWREQELVAWVLKPAAFALAALHEAGLTHRAIRPNNLFRAGQRGPVTLGPCWAAPPASLQPSVCEPPYAAWCGASARGDGTIADDVYALGVTLLALALGRLPMAGLEDGRVIRRKLEVGSFAALTEDANLPPLIADLLRVMLAEDPDHRPSPALLLNTEQARARRVAARPPRRAQRPLEVANTMVSSARELAYAVGANPDRGAAMLKNGTIDRWLRRFLGDPQLAIRLEEFIHPRGEAAGAEVRDQASIVMRAVALFDPLAPLVWRGQVVMLDALGDAIPAAGGEAAAALEEIVAKELVFQLASVAGRRQDLAALRSTVREWRAWQMAPGPAGGMRRVSYGLSPLLACQSPLLTEGAAARLADLLPALEAASAKADRKRLPIDPHITAFVAARADLSVSADLATLSNFADDASRMTVLRMFGRLQSRMHPAPLPGLARWLLESGVAGVERWQSRKTRALLEKKLAQAVQDGQIPVMLATVEDTASLSADSAAASRAADRIAALEEQLARIDGESGLRAQSAQRLGHEIATGIGLIATLGAAISLAAG